MTYTFFDNFRGFAGKTTPIRYFLGNNNMHPDAKLSSPRWSPHTDEKGMPTNKGYDTPLWGSNIAFGAGFLCTGLLTDPSALKSFIDALSFGLPTLDIDPSTSLTILTVVGSLSLALPTLSSLLSSACNIYHGFIDNYDKFGAPCTALELAQKFMAIFTDSILSLASAALQASYGIASLLAAFICFITYPIPGFNEKTGLHGVKTHLKDFSTAYMDIIAHVTSAGLSLIINLGDFLGSAKANLCCSNKPEETRQSSTATP